MVHNLAYSNDILDTFGVLSSFDFTKAIWEKYEGRAIPKIEAATLKIRGAVFYIKDLTSKQAQKELESLNQIIPVLNKLQSNIENITDKDFIRFKKTAIEFFDAVDQLHDNLQDVSRKYASYEMSLPVLAEDWDSKKDEHWNNY